MNEEKPQDGTQTPRDGIPAPLLNQLHEANDQFHRAREHVEQANAALVNPTEERQRAAKHLRDAEHAVEEIEQKIGNELNKP